MDTVKGVAYYNDSKGTNPDAAIKGIKAMNRPTWLIGGGYDKKSTYDEWIEAFDGKVKELILMGVTAPKIADCAKTHGFDKIKFVDSMEEAVSYIAGKAQDGEAVLLSPACASWGMFKNSLVEPIDDAQRNIYDIYMDLLKNSGHEFDHPEVMIYMIIEMVAGSCYNVILTGEPVSVDELKPYLYQSIRLIIRNHIL